MPTTAHDVDAVHQWVNSWQWLDGGGSTVGRLFIANDAWGVVATVALNIEVVKTPEM